MSTGSHQGTGGSCPKTHLPERACSLRPLLSVTCRLRVSLQAGWSVSNSSHANTLWGKLFTTTFIILQTKGEESFPASSLHSCLVTSGCALQLLPFSQAQSLNSPPTPGITHVKTPWGLWKKPSSTTNYLYLLFSMPLTVKRSNCLLTTCHTSAPIKPRSCQGH